MTTGWRAFVPGRLEIVGKHTDYAGGRSLVAAVPRGITVAAEPSSRGGIVIEPAAGEPAVFSVRGDGPADGWRRYASAVIRRLAGNFPDADLGARIEWRSDLPQAAGISSSSALVVGLAEALIACGRIESSGEWRRAIQSLEDRAAYFGCIENGASFGDLAGEPGVGTHGGSEDHAAIILSRSGHLHQFSFSPLRLDRSVPMPHGWTFVVASTGIAARKTGGARDDYNRAAAMVSAIVDAWRAGHPGDARSLGELARSQEPLRKLALPEAVSARLDHFLREDARVPEAAAAFERADVEHLGELAAASQRDAEQLLRNQVPETIDLVALAREAGAFASSGFGAGWGGSAWALVPGTEAERFLAEWLRAYRTRHPRLPADGFVSPPGDGLVRL